MTKLELIVRSGFDKSGDARIIRELDPHDERSINEYLRDLLAEVPRNENEMKTLLGLYMGLEGYPTELGLVLPSQEYSPASRMCEISSKEKHFGMLAAVFEFELDAEKVSEDKKELLLFKEYRFKENVKSYMAWQRRRMIANNYAVPETCTCCQKIN